MGVFYWFFMEHFVATAPTIQVRRQRRKHEYRTRFPPQQSEVALENDSREAGFAVSSLLLAGIFDARDSTVTDDLDLQHFLKCCIN